MNKAWAQRQGFTIVELLIVIVVIAILAAITLISFNGITAQANESRRLSAIDASEKLARLVVAERSDGLFSSGTVTYQVNGSDITFNYPNDIPRTTVKEVTDPYNFKQGGTDEPKCLPGDYPATDVFNEGECWTQFAVFTKQGQTQGVIYGTRMAYSTANWYVATVAPKYASQAPAVPSDNLISEVIDMGQIDLTATNPELGVGTVKLYKASRGVQINYTTGLAWLPGNAYSATATVTGFTYIVPADASCGRGEKSFVDMGGYGTLLSMTDAELAAAAEIPIEEVPTLRQQIQDQVNLLASQGTPLKQTTCTVKIQ